MDFREVTENEDSVEVKFVNEESINENISSNEETENSQVEIQEDEIDDSNDYEDICYICRRPESIAGKMINIYGGMKICIDEELADCYQRDGDKIIINYFEKHKLKVVEISNRNTNYDISLLDKVTFITGYAQLDSK